MEWPKIRAVACKAEKNSLEIHDHAVVVHLLYHVLLYQANACKLLI